MRSIQISDITMKVPPEAGGFSLSFREKIELHLCDAYNAQYDHNKHCNKYGIRFLYTEFRHLNLQSDSSDHFMLPIFAF